jgi:predicted metal-binding membrane protein
VNGRVSAKAASLKPCGAPELTDPVRSVPPSLSRQRNAIIVALLVLAAAGWYVVVDQASRRSGMGDDMGMSRGPDLTMGSATLFFTMWVAMMIAMMFPAAAPMVVMYGRMRRNDPFSVALFTGSYISLWIAFGAVAFGLGWIVEDRVAHSMWVADNWARGGGVLLLAAGLYQLTPLKDVCLRHCRTPLAFVMQNWRDGRVGAVEMGLRHGMYCVGCCWLLFLILVPLGVMNLAAMIAVTLVVFTEKVLPWGRGLGRIAAVGLIVYGALVLARPSLFPTMG